MEIRIATLRSAAPGRRDLTVQNHVSAFLAEHAGGHVGVGVDNERHDRGVRHPQALHPVNPQVRIHHGKGVTAHLAGADGVIDGLRLGSDIGAQFRIALRVGAGELLGAAIGIKGRGGNDAACQPDAGKQHAHIGIQMRRQHANL